MSPVSSARNPSNKWIIALAITTWAIVITAAVLLFAWIGYCYVGDPLLKNLFVCRTLMGTAGYDFIIVVIGIPPLILIDNLVRNPVNLKKFSENRELALVLVILLVLVYWLFFYWIVL